MLHWCMVSECSLEVIIITLTNNFDDSGHSSRTFLATSDPVFSLNSDMNSFKNFKSSERLTGKRSTVFKLHFTWNWSSLKEKNQSYFKEI